MASTNSASSPSPSSPRSARCAGVTRLPDRFAAVMFLSSSGEPPAPHTRLYEQAPAAHSPPARQTAVVERRLAQRIRLPAERRSPLRARRILREALHEAGLDDL